MKGNAPIWLKIQYYVVKLNITNVSWGSLYDGGIWSKYLRSKSNLRFFPLKGMGVEVNSSAWQESPVFWSSTSNILINSNHRTNCLKKRYLYWVGPHNFKILTNSECYCSHHRIVFKALWVLYISVLMGLIWF